MKNGYGPFPCCEAVGHYMSSQSCIAYKKMAKERHSCKISQTAYLVLGNKSSYRNNKTANHHTHTFLDHQLKCFVAVPSIIKVLKPSDRGIRK